MADKDAVQETSTIPLERYVELVEMCACERLDVDIANGSSEHARILIGKLFEIAQKEVCIITGRLSVVSEYDGVPIYGDTNVIRNALRFLQRPGSRLRIVVESGEVDGGSENELLKAIRDNPQTIGRVEVQVPPAGDLDAISVPHGMIVDQGPFRIEPNKPARYEKDRNSITAIANFGNPKRGMKFHSYFETLYGALEEKSRKGPVNAA